MKEGEGERHRREDSKKGLKTLKREILKVGKGKGFWSKEEEEEEEEGAA